VDRSGLRDVNFPSAAILDKRRCRSQKGGWPAGFRITNWGVKSVHESSAVVYDLSTTITAFKSWIAWEHSLRFKGSPTEDANRAQRRGVIDNRLRRARNRPILGGWLERPLRPRFFGPAPSRGPVGVNNPAIPSASPLRPSVSGSSEPQKPRGASDGHERKGTGGFQAFTRRAKPVGGTVKAPSASGRCNRVSSAWSASSQPVRSARTIRTKSSRWTAVRSCDHRR
jgi:hypothetical protein